MSTLAEVVQDLFGPTEDAAGESGTVRTHQDTGTVVVTEAALRRLLARVDKLSEGPRPQVVTLPSGEDLLVRAMGDKLAIEHRPNPSASWYPAAFLDGYEITEAEA